MGGSIPEVSPEGPGISICSTSCPPSLRPPRGKCCRPELCHRLLSSWGCLPSERVLGSARVHGTGTDPGLPALRLLFGPFPTRVHQEHHTYRFPSLPPAAPSESQPQPRLQDLALAILRGARVRDTVWTGVAAPGRGRRLLSGGSCLCASLLSQWLLWSESSLLLQDFAVTSAAQSTLPSPRGPSRPRSEPKPSRWRFV